MPRYASQEEAFDEFVDALLDAAEICAQMTPREQAEAAWTPTSRFSVDELEAQIRAEREQDRQPLQGRPL